MFFPFSIVFFPLFGGFCLCLLKVVSHLFPPCFGFFLLLSWFPSFFVFVSFPKKQMGRCFRGDGSGRCSLLLICSDGSLDVLLGMDFSRVRRELSAILAGLEVASNGLSVL